MNKTMFFFGLAIISLIILFFIHVDADRAIGIPHHELPYHEYHFDVDNEGYTIYGDNNVKIGRLVYGDNPTLDSMINKDNE